MAPATYTPNLEASMHQFSDMEARAAGLER